MEQTITKIGIREFRNNISKYLSADTVAVTHHGRTVGYYIPIHSDPSAEDLVALKDAARKLAALLASNNITEDELIADFRHAREGTRVE